MRRGNGSWKVDAASVVKIRVSGENRNPSVKATTLTLPPQVNTVPPRGGDTALTGLSCEISRDRRNLTHF